MFLFIGKTNLAGATLQHSNTSHVLIYRKKEGNFNGNGSDSNTSHVLIYLSEIMLLSYADRFKYISCSYLSFHIGPLRLNNLGIQIHLMFLFIITSVPISTEIIMNSNTSHVLIYRLPI